MVDQRAQDQEQSSAPLPSRNTGAEYNQQTLLDGATAGGLLEVSAAASETKEEIRVASIEVLRSKGLSQTSSKHARRSVAKHFGFHEYALESRKGEISDLTKLVFFVTAVQKLEGTDPT